MRTLWLLPIGAALALGACGQSEKTTQAPDNQPSGVVTLRTETVEVGCASCVYGMPGVQGCKLAAVVNNNTILVTGTDLDLHDHDLCSVSKDAVVSGTVDGDTMVVTSIELD